MPNTVSSYDVGGRARCTAIFTDDNGALVDPDNVYFQFKTPDGTITNYQYTVDSELLRDSLGTFHVDLDVSAVGTWAYRFYGVATNGTNQGAAYTVFSVRESPFSP